MKQKFKNVSNNFVVKFVYLVIMCLCVSAAGRDDDDETVVFYEDFQFTGDRLYLTLGTGCYTMSWDWDNRISSVNTQGSCIMAYDKTNCRGSGVKLTGAIEDFRDIRFDNKMSSLSVCTILNGGIDRPRYRSGSSSNSGLEIWKVGLEEHNRYRKLHGVPPLHGDRQLHDDAQEHADYLAKNNRFELSPGSKYGENLSTSYENDKLDAVREVIKRWYDKIEYYNFRNPKANRERPKSEQFSSIIWKSTTHMGIGVAKNKIDDKWVVVVFYDPGATRSRYRENVPLPL